MGGGLIHSSPQLSFVAVVELGHSFWNQQQFLRVKLAVSVLEQLEQPLQALKELLSLVACWLGHLSFLVQPPAWGQPCLLESSLECLSQSIFFDQKKLSLLEHSLKTSLLIQQFPGFYSPQHLLCPRCCWQLHQPSLVFCPQLKNSLYSPFQGFWSEFWSSPYLPCRGCWLQHSQYQRYVFQQLEPILEQQVRHQLVLQLQINVLELEWDLRERYWLFLELAYPRYCQHYSFQKLG